MEDEREAYSENSYSSKSYDYLKGNKDTFKLKTDYTFQIDTTEEIVKNVVSDINDIVSRESLSVSRQARERSIFDRQLSLDFPSSSVLNRSCNKTLHSLDGSFTMAELASTDSCDIFTTSPTLQPPAHFINTGPTRSSSCGSVEQHLNIPLLSHLDPHNTGFLIPLSVTSYWESLGVADGNQVLEDLGLDKEQGRLNTRTVSQRLNEEIVQLLEIVRYPAVQAAIATLWDEVATDKTSLDNVTKERDKLKDDIQEAQRTAAELAMEMDEQYYKHDRDLQEKNKVAEDNLLEELRIYKIKTDSECDAREITTQLLKSNFQGQKHNFELAERRHKEEINSLIQRNNQLEHEIKTTNRRIQETEDLNCTLKTELESTRVLTGRLSSIDNFPGPKFDETEASLDLVKNVEELVRVNKELKDRNEELEINMLSIPFKDSSPTSQYAKKTKRKSCHPSNSPSSSSMFKLKKKNQNLTEIPPELKYLAYDYEIENDEDDILSLSDIWCNFDDQDKVSSSNLTEPCATLGDELDHVKYEIVKMISEKGQISTENEIIQNYKIKISELQEESEKLRQTVKELECTSFSDPHNSQRMQDNSTLPDILVDNNSFKDPITSSDRSSPDGQEIDDDCLTQPCQGLRLNTTDISCLEEHIETAAMDSEKNKLLENNKHLEESLELIQSEFESMEDYWQKKIDGERMFYEEQIKVSENQFKELELRLKEYEELLSGVESAKLEESIKLYNIDEQASLEEKVNEWEKEIEELKMEIESMETVHEEELLALKETLDSSVNANLQTNNVGTFYSHLQGTNRSELCHKCTDFASLSNKRRHLELSWIKVVNLDTNEKLAFPPDQNLLTCSERYGPSSLPPDTETAYQQEVRRLQDLRRYIQADCDQLLLRKEKLQTEVSSLMQTEEIEGSILSAGRKIEEHDSVEFDVPVHDAYCHTGTSCDVGTQAPHVDSSEHGICPNSALKVILLDISSQTSLLVSSLSSLSSCPPLDKLLLYSLLSRLEHQANRSKQLHSSLALQRARYSTDMAVTRDRHTEEISQLESLVLSSQDLLKKQTRKYMEKVDKQVMADTNIKKLITDNQKLTEEIKVIKKQWEMNDKKHKQGESCVEIVITQQEDVTVRDGANDTGW